MGNCSSSSSSSSSYTHYIIIRHYRYATVYVCLTLTYETFSFVYFTDTQLSNRVFLTRRPALLTGHCLRLSLHASTFSLSLGSTDVLILMIASLKKKKNLSISIEIANKFYSMFDAIIKRKMSLIRRSLFS